MPASKGSLHRARLGRRYLHRLSSHLVAVFPRCGAESVEHCRRVFLTPPLSFSRPHRSPITAAHTTPPSTHDGLWE